MITDNFIGNNRSSEGNKLFKTFNPVSNEMNPWEFVEATEAEVERAMVLASDAFLATVNWWKNQSHLFKNYSQGN